MRAHISQLAVVFFLVTLANGVLATESLMDAEYERSIAGKDPREILEDVLGWPPRYKK